MTPHDLRRACGLVAHALSTPLNEVLDLPMSEFRDWLKVAQEILAMRPVPA
ncbi:hypothetical protein [Tropicimonas sp. IMCC34043]|uniref:hypothetical protein n=1 Tax=Tropicimonas sp. IMCC34043 TaxID=2248760 RepID=UPI0013002B98|nr:hypothetical protein [Tropicimonas sp. IMCC34043]